MSDEQPDRLPLAIYRIEFEEERTALFEDDAELEVSAWMAVGALLALCVLAIGLGVLWLLGVVRG